MASNFTATSGAKVTINMASWGDVMALKSAIQKEYSSSDTKLDVDIGNLSLSSDLDINSIIKIIMAVDSSEKVYHNLFDCLKKCTYNGEKITPSTFEEEDARQDYYEIVVECLKVNFTPFLKGLTSGLKKMFSGENTKSPEQK